jgi:hypothetical protein
MTYSSMASFFLDDESPDSDVSPDSDEDVVSFFSSDLGSDCLSYLSSISYTKCPARFISAYGQGLTSPEAASANCEYHGHRTVPPDMALKPQKEHEKKYSDQEK